MKTSLLVAALSLLPALAAAQETSLAALRAGASTPSGAIALGRALRRAGRFEEAMRVLNGVRDPAMRADARWEAARVRIDQGAYRPAQAACNAIPAGQRRRVCLARAYLVWHRVALADRELEAARSMGAGDGELLLATGDARRMASDPAAAETAYRAAAQAMPERPEPQLGLGAVADVAQRLDDAEAAYRRAVAADPTDPQSALALGQFMLRRRGNAAEALPLLRRAVADRPQWPEALTAMGDALVATGDAAAARAAFEAALRIAPTQTGAQAGLGRALLGLQLWREAEAPFRRALDQVGTDASAYVGIAEVYEHTQREPEAMQAWDAAIDRAPTDPVIRLRAAELAHRTQQNALARAYVDRVLADAPRHAGALVLRGIIAAEEGDRPAARVAFTAALSGEGAIDRAAVEQRLRELDQPARPRRR
ncbi:MAG: tetratricopeptide repeat protein [Myxococcales bacterium]|nr:tetratricopeptide repeat protein [Myxococcales bacterium]